MFAQHSSVPKAFPCKLDPIGAIGNYWAWERQPSEQEVSLLQALPAVCQYRRGARPACALRHGGLLTRADELMYGEKMYGEKKSRPPVAGGELIQSTEASRQPVPVRPGRATGKWDER